MASFQQTPAGQTLTFTFGYDTPGNIVIAFNTPNATTNMSTLTSKTDGSMLINMGGISFKESSDYYTSSNRNKVAPGWRRKTKLLSNGSVAYPV